MSVATMVRTYEHTADWRELLAPVRQRLTDPQDTTSGQQTSQFVPR